MPLRDSYRGKRIVPNNEKRLSICGIPIGVLCLEAYHAKVPGILRNASTFKFPVAYKVVKGATIERLINRQDPSLLTPFIEAVRELEEEGVRAITGSCGFMVLFQRELAEAVNIPVFISSLIQLPMVHLMLRRDQKVGILTARKDKLTKDHLRAVGAESLPVCIAGMDDQEEFSETIILGRKREMDIDRLEEEVLSVVDKLAQENPGMGALVIECTDLPPFAHLIQQKVNIPIFDITTLTNMVYDAVVRTCYQGIMPR
jgi:aspartate/glutamate racemase